MKKTFLNDNKNYIELREGLISHFKQNDVFDSPKYDSLEEAFMVGEILPFNNNVDINEKHESLVKVLNTINYYNLKHQTAYTMVTDNFLTLNQLQIQRNVIASLFLMKRKGENYFYSLVYNSYKLILKMSKTNDENIYYIANDTLLYMMDYLNDSRVNTSSDLEVSLLTDLLISIEIILRDDIKNIQKTERLEYIINLYNCLGAYCYINNQYKLIEERMNLIAACVMGVQTDSYVSLIKAAVTAIYGLLEFKNFTGRSSLEKKLEELGGNK